MGRKPSSSRMSLNGKWKPLGEPPTAPGRALHTLLQQQWPQEAISLLPRLPGQAQWTGSGQRPKLVAVELVWDQEEGEGRPHLTAHCCPSPASHPSSSTLASPESQARPAHGTQQ